MLFIPTFSQRLKRLPFSPRQVFNQKGQSIIILAFAFLGLIAMLGLALDLGLVYIERTRIKRAVDAATLAAVVELPNEENAYLRAIAYLDENGYQLWDAAGNPQANVWVRGCSHDRYFSANNFDNYHDDTPVGGGMFTTTYGPDDDEYFLYFPPAGGPLAEARADFYINTRSFQSYDSANDRFFPDNQQCFSDGDPSHTIAGTANKINVSGVIPVDMNFMQFFGFAEVPVADAAIAQNVTSLDVAVVFDMSGSMQFDTSGLGFYEPFLDGDQRWYNIDNGTDYPNPDLINRIPIDHLPREDLSGNRIGDGARNAGQMCWQRDGNTVDYFTVGGGGDPRRYVVMEAELYSLNTSLLAGPYRQPGRGYWSVQNTDRRTVDQMMYGGNRLTGARPILDNDRDYQGSWVSHNPFVNWSIQDEVPFGHHYTRDEVRADPNSVPSLEYDFITANDWDGTSVDDTHIWIRAQGGYSAWSGTPYDIFWAVYEYTDLYGAANGNPENATPLRTGNIETADHQPGDGVAYGGAGSGNWSWVLLNDAGLDLDNGTRYTLKIWAGQPGYDIDQIVVGNRNNTAFTNNYSRGSTNLDATPGSAFRQACNRCNPIYGLTIVNQTDCAPPNDNGANTVPQNGYDLSDPTNNPLYSGYQPIRGAKEALKRFISKMNPRFDQVGIVAYSSAMNTIDGWTSATPPEGTVELRCLKKEASDCFSGANPISYTQVLETIEQIPPSGGTNIAQGMLRGLEMLGVNADGVGGYDPSVCDDDNDHCSRGGAARRILIVMSDGVANNNPYDNGPSNVNCYVEDLYTTNTGTGAENRAKDCVMHYGQIAADNNVTIYTIGLGNGVDVQMMTEVAEMTGSGEYFAALSTAQLDGIFETILKSVSVRLVE